MLLLCVVVFISHCSQRPCIMIKLELLTCVCQLLFNYCSTLLLFFLLECLLCNVMSVLCFFYALKTIASITRSLGYREYINNTRCLKKPQHLSTDMCKIDQNPCVGFSMLHFSTCGTCGGSCGWIRALPLIQRHKHLEI